MLVTCLMMNLLKFMDESLLVCDNFYIYVFIAPSSPPRRVVVVPISSRSLQVSWQPPSTPNGQITEYHINITEINTNTWREVRSTSLTKLITGLHPYYTYITSVAAVTIGKGPYSTPIRIRTFSDGRQSVNLKIL